MKAGLVRVILSTYNAESFIRPLLDSVLGQTYRSLELWVRDDGSRDATPAILAEYASQHVGRMHVVLGPNVGMVRSYFSVIRAAGREAEYTAFCDHDDVWHAEKIEHAVHTMRAHGGNASPLLYTGRLHIVDEQLRHLAYSRVPAKPMSFNNALVENVAAGCTMVMNSAARDLLLACDDLDGICWPDWWFYLLTSAFGTVIYDERAYVEYRRHSANAVGSPAPWSLRRVREGLRQIRSARMQGGIVLQAETLRRHYGASMPAKNRALLTEFLDQPTTLFGRVRHALSCAVYRQRATDGAVIRLLLLTRGAPT